MPQLKHEVEIENPKTKVKSKIVLKGAQDFFVLPSLTTGLENFYKTQFALIHHHKYSLTELENMLHIYIYINQLVQYLKEENERRRERSMRK